MYRIMILLLFITLTIGSQIAGAETIPDAEPSSVAQQTPPTIVSFTTDLETISVADAEAGTQTTTLSWRTVGMTDSHDLVLHAYAVGGWVFLLEEDQILPANGSISVTVRHPLTFRPPTYRLAITDQDRVHILNEQTVSIPYKMDTEAEAAPSIQSFTTSVTSISANALAYENAQIPVAWEITGRTLTANLVFEQVLSDGSTIDVELPRDTLWVSSAGTGTVAPSHDGPIVRLRLRLVDLMDETTLDEAMLEITVTGAVSTPTPMPTTPSVSSGGGSSGSGTTGDDSNPPPVVNPGAGGGFELGGHVVGFGYTGQMRSAGMNWVKVQVRWNLGDGTGAAASVINQAHTNGFKVLLGIVGYSGQMGDFESYINAYAAHLGQVAALGPDAIEVWNEPNLAREWPAGTINGTNYTRLLASSYNAIKAANANVMVISAALAPTGFFGGCATNGCDDNTFLSQMASAGAANYMDCIGAHYNEGIISPDQRSGDPRGGHYSRYFWGTLDLYYNTFGGARWVCWTELGYLSGDGYPPLPADFVWAGNTTVAQHAEWLGRATALSRSSGRVRLMIIWNVDFTVYNDDPQAGYAIIRPDGSCPACGTLGAAMQ